MYKLIKNKQNLFLMWYYGIICQIIILPDNRIIEHRISGSGRSRESLIRYSSNSYWLYFHFISIRNVWDNYEYWYLIRKNK